jgi:hypothetical protein
MPDCYTDIVIIDDAHDDLPGGIPQYSYNLARSLNLIRGRKVLALCLGFRDLPLNRSLFQGKLDFVVYSQNLGIRDMKSLKRKISELLISRIFCDGKSLNVHTTDAYKALALRLTGLRSRIILYHLVPPQNIIFSKVFNKTASKSGIIHRVSSKELFTLYRSLGVESKIVPPAICIDDIKEILAKKKVPPELIDTDFSIYYPVLSYIGAIEFNRFNMSFVLKLLKQLESKGYNPLFILAVRFTERTPEFLYLFYNYIKKYDLEKNIKVLPRFIDLREKFFIISTSTLGIYSYYESPGIPFTIPPYTIIEYLALGKSIVVTSPIKYLQDLIKNNLITITKTPEEAVSLVTSLNNRVNQYAINYVERKHSCRSIASLLEDLR